MGSGDYYRPVLDIHCGHVNKMSLNKHDSQVSQL